MSNHKHKWVLAYYTPPYRMTNGDMMLSLTVWVCECGAQKQHEGKL